jgi:hypothetical protein
MARHLAAGVHTGVGPPGNRQRHRLAPHTLECCLELALDRPLARLARPAGKGAAVVFEEQPSGQALSGPAPGEIIFTKRRAIMVNGRSSVSPEG